VVDVGILRHAFGLTVAEIVLVGSAMLAAVDRNETKQRGRNLG
jgi:hypothetical protein